MKNQNWQMPTIGEITSTIKKWDQKGDGDFYYFDISSIDNQTNKITSPKLVAKSEAPSRAKQIVQSGDVLFSTVRTYLRNIALVPEGYENGIASTGFSVLRGKPEVSTKYIFYFSLTQSFINKLSDLQRGSSYPAVRDSDVRNQVIPLPSFEEQTRIVVKIDELFSKIEHATNELKAISGFEKAINSKTAQLKQSILKQAFAGELI